MNGKTMERILAHILVAAIPVTCGWPTTSPSKDMKSVPCSNGGRAIYGSVETTKIYDWRGLIPPPDLAPPPPDLRPAVDLAPPPDLRPAVDLAPPSDAGQASDGGSQTDAGAEMDAGDPRSIPRIPLPEAECRKICANPSVESCSGGYAADGTPQVICQDEYLSRCDPPKCGRRPEGLTDAEVGAHETPGGYLAEAAFLEAASVTAFRRLAAELHAHGAPNRLLQAARRAARDEVRHARIMGRLAQRYRATVKTPPTTEMGIRDLESIALENAVEGCVFETYGAMIAAAQARLARDKVVRAVLRRIAIDEARHAALAFEVARWCHGRLDSEAQKRVEEAKRRAVKELTLAARREPPTEVVQEMGIPSAALAQALLAGLHAELWQAERKPEIHSHRG